MTLKERINADFMEAYKTKQMEKKNFLGVVKGAIQTQEGKSIESNDENVLKVLKSIEKGILENIEGRKTMNLDTTEQELELNIIKPYLPELMSEDKVREAIKSIITEHGKDKNVGFLTGTFAKTYRNTADMNMVKKILTEELA